MEWDPSGAHNLPSQRDAQDVWMYDSPSRDPTIPGADTEVYPMTPPTWTHAQSSQHPIPAEERQPIDLRQLELRRAREEAAESEPVQATQPMKVIHPTLTRADTLHHGLYPTPDHYQQPRTDPEHTEELQQKLDKQRERAEGSTTKRDDEVDAVDVQEQTTSIIDYLEQERKYSTNHLVDINILLSGKNTRTNRNQLTALQREIQSANKTIDSLLDKLENQQSSESLTAIQRDIDQLTKSTEFDKRFKQIESQINAGQSPKTKREQSEPPPTITTDAASSSQGDQKGVTFIEDAARSSKGTASVRAKTSGRSGRSGGPATSRGKPSKKSKTDFIKVGASILPYNDVGNDVYFIK